MNTSFRPACVTLLTLAAVFSAVPLQAATPLQDLRYSPDVTLQLSTETVQDHAVATDDLSGGVTLLSIGTIPTATDLDAYHLLTGGDQLFSFDTTVSLPGSTTVATDGDVVRFDGSVYTIEFDAEANGLPAEVDIGAVTLFGDDLLVSFDVDVQLDGITFHDEDLARFDGAGFSLFFDGAGAGLATSLAVDGAHYLDCNGHLLLSLDGSGSIGGVIFNDEDVLEYDPGPGTWSLAYDGSTASAEWEPADIDALHATADPGPGPATPFGQTLMALANETEFIWTNPVDFVVVQGEFVSSTQIGTYVVDWDASGSGTSITDTDTPVAGRGFWYLVRLGGCELRSWQTSLGDEPGRDTVLP